MLVARTKRKAKRTKIVCLSHKEDADGISSAALIRQAFGGTSVLVDYPSLMEALEKIASDNTLKRLFICDLGLSKKNQDPFVAILASMRKKRISITYIDHHDIAPKIHKQLEKLGIVMVHDVNECASVLVYQKFSSKMPNHARFIAACAAITDYMEDRKIGSKLLQTYDRQFALISATVLTYNIVTNQKNIDYLHGLVDELADSKYPHEIKGAFEQARVGVERLAGIMEEVKKNFKKAKNFGYVETKDSGAGGAVNFALGFSGKNVGVAYKLRTTYGIYAVSVRGTKNCKVHLGKIINKLASDLGGSGGGHKKACGAIIPKAKIKIFLRKLDASIK